jgi:hypothetical protein
MNRAGCGGVEVRGPVSAKALALAVCVCAHLRHSHAFAPASPNSALALQRLARPPWPSSAQPRRYIRPGTAALRMSTEVTRSVCSRFSSRLCPGHAPRVPARAARSTSPASGLQLSQAIGAGGRGFPVASRGCGKGKECNCCFLLASHRYDGLADPRWAHGSVGLAVLGSHCSISEPALRSSMPCTGGRTVLTRFYAQARASGQAKRKQDVRSSNPARRSSSPATVTGAWRHSTGVLESKAATENSVALQMQPIMEAALQAHLTLRDACRVSPEETVAVEEAFSGLDDILFADRYGRQTLRLP